MLYILSAIRFASTNRNILQIWNRVTLTKENTLTFKDTIWEICVSGNKIIVSFWDGSIILIDDNLQRITLEQRNKQMTVLPNGDLLVLLRDCVNIWDLNTVTCIKKSEINGTHVSVCNNKIIIYDGCSLKAYI